MENVNVFCYLVVVTLNLNGLPRQIIHEESKILISVEERIDEKICYERCDPGVATEVPRFRTI